jgi:DUF4097 and DUF4098 domain-containing protein YvlB
VGSADELRIKSIDLKPNNRTISFEILVPKNCNLSVKLNEMGDIKVTSSKGNINLMNAVGNIQLQGITGKLSAIAPNGTISASLDPNISQLAYFSSINGDILIETPRQIDATIELKGMPGNISTPFPITEKNPSTDAAKMGGARWYNTRLGKATASVTAQTIYGKIKIFYK